MKNWLQKGKNEENESQSDKASDKALEALNFSDFLDRVMGDKDLAVSILEEFAGLIGEHAEKLRHAVESGDHENIRQIGHMIKGESGNISAPALYESSYAIEKAGKTENSTEQQQILPVLLTDIDNLKEAIREILEKERK